MSDPNASPADWPALPYAEWKDTYETLHMWSQIVGKIRLAATRWINHQWHVSLYVTPRGLTTSLVPHGPAPFQIELDLVDHRLRIERAGGRSAEVGLYERTVADFHDELMSRMHELGLPVQIHGSPNEVPDPIPFAEDETHGSYDPDAVARLREILVRVAGVFLDFRGAYLGKSSPVHLFWGAFDLAVTRFSGRPAPEHPGGVPGLPDWLTREAYSHEVCSVGFWPGGPPYPDPMFYAYGYPTPDGLSERTVRPDAAGWLEELGEFVLPYEAVRTSPDPAGTLMEFLDSSYEAVAELGDWDRDALEWPQRGRPVHGDGAAG